MSRIGINDINNYSEGEKKGSGFFSLKDDGDVKKVRFLYNSVEDVQGYAVHEVEVNGKKRYVNCLRTYDDPIDNCPLCKSGSLQKIKLFVPIYDLESKSIKFWERGRKFFNKMSGLCARYSKEGVSLSSVGFEIERHGKKGDKETTYEIFPMDEGEEVKNNVDIAVKDIMAKGVPTALGGIILDKTSDEMSSLNGVSTNETPITRRTPATREDRF